MTYKPPRKTRLSKDSYLLFHIVTPSNSTCDALPHYGDTRRIPLKFSPSFSWQIHCLVTNSKLKKTRCFDKIALNRSICCCRGSPSSKDELSNWRCQSIQQQQHWKKKSINAIHRAFSSSSFSRNRSMLRRRSRVRGDVFVFRSSLVWAEVWINEDTRGSCGKIPQTTIWQCCTRKKKKTGPACHTQTLSIPFW